MVHPAPRHAKYRSPSLGELLGFKGIQVMCVPDFARYEWLLTDGNGRKIARQGRHIRPAMIERWTMMCWAGKAKTLYVSTPIYCAIMRGEG